MKVPKTKLLLYTDCDFFAGCEKPLENISKFTPITDQYDVVYVYRYNRRYRQDLQKKSLPVRLYALRLLTPNFFLRLSEKRGKILHYVTRGFLFPFRAFQIFNFFYLIRQLALLLVEKPQVVHINNGGYPGADSCRTMALAARLMGVKRIIMTVNNMAVPSSNIFQRIFDVLINSSVQSFVTASRAASKQLINVRGMDKAKFQAIPNAVLFDDREHSDTNAARTELGIGRDTLLIGSAGLLIKRKGYDILVEAAARIDPNLDWHIVVYGEGDQKKHLENLITQYGLEGRVSFPGYKDNILNYISELDVFVLPTSGSEDMPNAINEAMLLKKPIVGTLTSGVPEQVTSEWNGFLSEPGNHIDLADKLHQVIALEPDDLKKMGERSFDRYVEKFSYQIAMRKYQKLYSQEWTNTDDFE